MAKDTDYYCLRLLLLIILLLIPMGCTQSAPEEATVAPTQVETADQPGEVTTPAVEEEPQQVETADDEDPRDGGSMTFVITSGIDGMDPNRFRGRFFDLFKVVNIYDRLIAKDPATGEFFGNLADSWEISDDGTVYTFHLKDGPMFHDGTVVNAEAIKFNIERIRDENASAQVANMIAPIEEVNVLDEFTVEFRLSTPFGPLLDNLSSPILSIVSPAAAEEYGEELTSNPVGSGPFKFREWVVGELVVLEKNPDYNWAPEFFDHQGPPYLDEVRFVYISEEGSRLAAFEAEEIDILYYPPLREVERYQNDPNFTVKFIPRPGIPRIMGMNTDHWPLDDPLVRRAVAYAIDTQLLHEVIFEGIGTEASSLLCPGTFGFNAAIEESWPKYAPERVAALMEEAGFSLNADDVWEKDGRTFSPVLWSISDPFWTNMGETLATNMRDVGIAVQHETYEAAAYLEGAYQGIPDFSNILQFSTDADILWNVAHSSSQRTSANVAFYENSEVDNLLEEARTSSDQDSRYAIYAQIQEILMEDMPYVPYLCQHDINIFSTDLDGIKHDPMGPAMFYDLHYVP